MHSIWQKVNYLHEFRGVARQSHMACSNCAVLPFVGCCQLPLKPFAWPTNRWRNANRMVAADLCIPKTKTKLWEWMGARDRGQGAGVAIW